MSRPETSRSRKGNYRSLVIAGLGSVGGSLWRLGFPDFVGFDRVVGMDKDPPGLPGGESILRGDITDSSFPGKFLENLPEPVLLVNLCSGVDNLAIRRKLAGRPCAYLDTCAAASPHPAEYRFSRLMPRTLESVDSMYPHWLCWGINPGVVELAARRLMEEMGGTGPFAVTVFEHDGLTAGSEPGEWLAVGWSPGGLVEEVMLAPTLEIRDGRVREGRVPGARRALARWGEELVPSRIVGHEDIWNLGRLRQVGQARFVYGLHPGVMAELEGDPGRAASRLSVPAPETPLAGLERVAIQVRHLGSGKVRTRLWGTDHAGVWSRHGVNAVQWQTARSLLLAIRLLQETGYGLRPGTFCAADLPVNPADWRIIEGMMADLEIRWEPADDLNLELVA